MTRPKASLSGYHLMNVTRQRYKSVAVANILKPTSMHPVCTTRCFPKALRLCTVCEPKSGTELAPRLGNTMPMDRFSQAAAACICSAVSSVYTDELDKKPGSARTPLRERLPWCGLPLARDPGLVIRAAWLVQSRYE